MHSLSYVDLFAGAGGLSLGFRRAGFTCLAAYDNWQPAVETYSANLGNIIRRSDLSSGITLPQSPLIVGGPPCQGFSSAGPRRIEDERNSLVGEFGTLIAEHKPLAFVFENVEGFLTAGNGRFVKHLLDPIIEAGYQVHLRKINLANYGVPQHRKRVIAIGGLGWLPRFPEPTHSAFGAPGATLGNGTSQTPTPTLADCLSVLPRAVAGDQEPPVPDHVFTPLRNGDLARAEMLQPGQSMRDLPESLWHPSYKRRANRRVMDGTPTEKRGGAPAGVKRLIPNQPSKAITSGSIREFLHPTENRFLTIRECATIQTFPIDYVFHGTQAEKIQQIGNAIPALFAEKLAVSLMEDLKSLINTKSSRGKLHSFIPTLSSGMSPALRNVVDMVELRYSSDQAGGRQYTLWH